MVLHNVKNLKYWETVGANPPTLACLMSPKVCCELGHTTGPDDQIQIVLKEIQDANIVSYNLYIV